MERERYKNFKKLTWGNVGNPISKRVKKGAKGRERWRKVEKGGRRWLKVAKGGERWREAEEGG